MFYLTYVVLMQDGKATYKSAIKTDDGFPLYDETREFADFNEAATFDNKIKDAVKYLNACINFEAETGEKAPYSQKYKPKALVYEAYRWVDKIHDEKGPVSPEALLEQMVTIGWVFFTLEMAIECVEAYAEKLAEQEDAEDYREHLAYKYELERSRSSETEIY